ncbi:MAG: hypothetical protein Q7S74_01560 [Nanoarchaeota archaeon]|nr:hypothetical protein [Nanoarchaeota archaeon]
MENNRAFRPREPRSKISSCGCGGQARLVKRSVHNHGQKSCGITIVEYVCDDCNIRRPVVHEGFKRKF